MFCRAQFPREPIAPGHATRAAPTPRAKGAGHQGVHACRTACPTQRAKRAALHAQGLTTPENASASRDSPPAHGEYIMQQNRMRQQKRRRHGSSRRCIPQDRLAAAPCERISRTPLRSAQGDVHFSHARPRCAASQRPRTDPRAQAPHAGTDSISQPCDRAHAARDCPLRSLRP